MSTVGAVPSEPRPADYGLSPERVRYFNEQHWWTLLLLALAFLAFLGGYFPAVAVNSFVSEYNEGFAAFLAIVVWGATWTSAYAVLGRLEDSLNARREAAADYPSFLKYKAALTSYREVQRQRLDRQRWHQMDGWEFERELASLYRGMGFDARSTGGSGDGGIDLVLIEKATGRRIIVQSKAHSRPIGPGPVRELYGTLVHDKADEAWLVSKAGFSSSAREFAEGKAMRLIELDDVLGAARRASQARA